MLGDVEMYAEVLLAESVLKASALLDSQQGNGSPNMVCNLSFSTFPFISEADESGWNFVLNVFSDYFVLKATFNTNVMKYMLKVV